MRIDSRVLRPVFPYQINHLSNQARGLVAWWPMALGGGNRLYDLAGASINGTLINAPKWVTAGDRPALRFVTASSQYVTYAINALPFGNATIAFWVVWHTISGSHVAFSYRDTVVGGRIQSMIAQGSGSLLAYYGSTVSGLATAAATVVANRLYHITQVIQGGTVYLYVDGVLANTATGGVDGGASTFRPIIGASQTGDAPNAYASADVGDVRYYNRALSADEVYALYDPATRYELYWMPWLDIGYAAQVAYPRRGDMNMGLFV